VVWKSAGLAAMSSLLAGQWLFVLLCLWRRLAQQWAPFQNAKPHRATAEGAVLVDSQLVKNGLADIPL
jgi:hypothetical protein